MLDKIKAKAERQRQADLAKMAEARARLGELVSPKAAALVVAHVMDQALEQGLDCDLAVGISVEVLSGEMGLEMTLARPDLTQESLSELQARKPHPPALLEPFVEKTEGVMARLVADLGKRLAELEQGPDIFSSVTVSGSASLDLQLASLTLTVTASRES